MAKRKPRSAAQKAAADKFFDAMRRQTVYGGRNSFAVGGGVACGGQACGGGRRLLRRQPRST